MIAESFGGGATLGAVEWYPATQLKAEYDMPDLIIGNSIGSVTAFMRGLDRLDDLYEAWSKVNDLSHFQKIRLGSVWEVITKPLEQNRGFYSLKPLRQMFYDYDLDPKQLKVPTYVTFVDIVNKSYQQVQLNHLSKEDAYDAVIASCTQYPFHELATFKGAPVVDGGARHIIPFFPPKFYHSITELNVIACQPLDAPYSDNLLDDEKDVTVSRALELLTDVMERNDYRTLLEIKDRYNVKIQLIQPPYRPGASFDASKVQWRLNEVGIESWNNRFYL